MNEETTVPSTAAVTEAAEPPATEVPETVPETTDGTVATEPTVPEITQAVTAPSVEPTVETIIPETTAATLPEATEPVYWLDLTEPTEETVEGTIEETTEPVTVVEVIETVGSDLAHVILFGVFLIAGTLIGLALLRDRHGN